MVVKEDIDRIDANVEEISDDVDILRDELNDLKGALTRAGVIK